MRRIIGLIFIIGLCLFSLRVNAQGYSWPTPVSTPSPFVGVTAQPTPAPVLPQLYLCYEDFNPVTFAALNPVECGQPFTTAAGNLVGTGVSFSQANQPVGPFPATVTLIVNGVRYSSVPVNAVTGMIGYALLSGVQQLQIAIDHSATYQSASATVTTH